MDPFNQWGDENQTESHEMNEHAPINYNQNTYMTNDGREPSVESLNIDSMQAKRSERMGESRKSYHYEVALESNFWKYTEQTKSILAGLLLIFCGGMHTVWSIYQVVLFDTSELYRKEIHKLNETLLPVMSKFQEKNHLFMHGGLLTLTNISWYVGIMIGCFAAGWFLVRVVQKKNIYYIAALLMFVSGCLLYSSDVSDSGWESLLLGARFFAGISHGLAYVTLFVQASENAAKDFRRILVTVIGLTIGFSMFFSSVFVVNIPFLFYEIQNGTVLIDTDHDYIMSTSAMSTVTLVFTFVAVVINFFYSHETVPFLLYHNYREEEAVFMLGKLLGEDQNSPVVQQEYLALRELCNDDYAEFPEGKIFTTIHRSLMSIPLSARITSAQCINIFYIVLVAKYIQSWYNQDERDLIVDIDRENTTITDLFSNLEEMRALANRYRTIVPSEMSALFFGGLLFSLLSIYLNWKRGLHFCTFVTGAIMLVYSLLHYAKTLALVILIIYVHFLSLPIDILGYSYLMECFPTSTKAKAIGFVTICECLLNSLYMTVEFQHTHYFVEFFATGIIFFVFGYKLYCVVPNTNGLSLGAAKLAYVQAVSNIVWWKQWIPKRFYPTNIQSHAP